MHSTSRMQMQGRESQWSEQKDKTLKILFSDEEISDQFIKNGWNVFLKNTKTLIEGGSKIEDACNILDFFGILLNVNMVDELSEKLTREQLHEMRKKIKDFIAYCDLWNNCIFGDEKISEEEFNRLFEDWQKMISLALVCKREIYRTYNQPILKFINNIRSLLNINVDQTFTLKEFSFNQEKKDEIKQKYAKIKTQEEELQDKIDAEVKARKQKFLEEEKKVKAEAIAKAKAEKEKLESEKEIAANKKLDEELPRLFKDFYKTIYPAELYSIFFQLKNLLPKDLSKEWQENALEKIKQYLKTQINNILNDAKAFARASNEMEKLDIYGYQSLKKLESKLSSIEIEFSSIHDGEVLDLQTNELIGNALALLQEQISKLEKSNPTIKANISSEREALNNININITNEIMRSNKIFMKFEHYLVVADKVIVNKYSELENNKKEKGEEYRVQPKVNLLNAIFEKNDENKSRSLLEEYQNALAVYQLHESQGNKCNLALKIAQLKNYVSATDKLRKYNKKQSYTFTDVQILLALTTQSIFLTEANKKKEFQKEEFQKIEAIFNHVVRNAEKKLHQYKKERSFAKDIKTWFVNASHSFFKEPKHVPTETIAKDVLKNLKNMFEGMKREIKRETNIIDEVHGYRKSKIHLGR